MRRPSYSHETGPGIASRRLNASLTGALPGKFSETVNGAANFSETQLYGVPVTGEGADSHPSVLCIRLEGFLNAGSKPDNDSPLKAP